MAQNEQYIHFRLPVTQEFQETFSHFYYAENPSVNAITKTLLPSFQTVMVFNFGANALFTSRQGTTIAIDKCIVLGPIKRAFSYTLPPGAQILVANFRADAFHRFFGKAFLSDCLPVHPDEALLDNCFSHLWQELDAMASLSEKVNHILDFCRPYLNPRHPISDLFSNFKSDTLNPIKTIAEETGQSERNIQSIHKRQFGFSAKEAGRYQRFLRAVESIQHLASSQEKVNWFEVIDGCGYYDQSQLIHDFKHFINLSPKKFLKFQQDICKASGE